MPRYKEKKRFIYEHKASTNDYLIALASFVCFTKLLLPSNKSYHILLDWFIVNEEALKDENRKLPSIKELSEQVKMERSKLSKYLKDIYEDIISLNDTQPRLFMKQGQYLCNLSFSYLGCHAYFTLGLDVIPRIHDGISFYFIKPKNGGSTFYVKDVRHELDGHNHSIYISLTSDYPNRYLQLLKEKAYLHHYISFREFLEPMTYTEEEELVKWYKDL